MTMKKSKKTRKARAPRRTLLNGSNRFPTYPALSPMPAVALGLPAEQAGVFITIHLGADLLSTLCPAIASRKEMGFEPKYVEFILPDKIAGLKVLR